jgi:hypothetical protein
VFATAAWALPTQQGQDKPALTAPRSLAGAGAPATPAAWLARAENV